MVNGAFSQRFDGCSVENVITTSPNHYPILVSLSHSEWSGNVPVQHDFKFVAMWLRAPVYHELWENSWAGNSDGALSLLHVLLFARLQHPCVNQDIPQKLNQDMNDELCKALHALFQMGPTKAPDPDGYPRCFTSWDTYLERVHVAVRYCTVSECEGN